MKIGLISDTHDNMPKIEKAVVLFNQRNVDFVLHAGDYIAPFSLAPFSELNCQWQGVLGNNDGEKKGLFDKSENRITAGSLSLVLDNKRVMLVHNLALIKPQGYDIVVFGHTHRVEVKKNEYGLLVNPGECSGWLYGRSTLGILDTDSLNVEIIEL